MNPKNFTRPLGAYTPQTKGKGNGMFKEFDATELYCPRCKRPVPVRKRLLLVLPEGEKYEYLCAICSESVGSKIDRQAKPLSVIV
jgi:hypothetical protein